MEWTADGMTIGERLARKDNEVLSMGVMLTFSMQTFERTAGTVRHL